MAGDGDSFFVCERSAGREVGEAAGPETTGASDFPAVVYYLTQFSA